MLTCVLVVVSLRLRRAACWLPSQHEPTERQSRKITANIPVLTSQAVSSAERSWKISDIIIITIEIIIIIRGRRRRRRRSRRRRRRRMYIYHALINALSAHMIHINLNIIFYTHVYIHTHNTDGVMRLLNII